MTLFLGVSSCILYKSVGKWQNQGKCQAFLDKKGLQKSYFSKKVAEKVLG